MCLPQVPAPVRARPFHGASARREGGPLRLLVGSVQLQAAGAGVGQSRRQTQPQFGAVVSAGHSVHSRHTSDAGRCGGNSGRVPRPSLAPRTGHCHVCNAQRCACACARRAMASETAGVGLWCAGCFAIAVGDSTAIAIYRAISVPRPSFFPHCQPLLHHSTPPHSRSTSRALERSFFPPLSPDPSPISTPPPLRSRCDGHQTRVRSSALPTLQLPNCLQSCWDQRLSRLKVRYPTPKHQAPRTGLGTTPKRRPSTKVVFPSACVSSHVPSHMHQTCCTRGSLIRFVHLCMCQIALALSSPIGLCCT
jgi:hypothetical protein